MALANRDIVDELNRMSPAAANVKLGTLLESMITAINALIADHNTLRTKLNADAGVTDVNYAASTATPITALAARD